jgi:predicted HicB family RNase H-like nuclease
MSDKILQYGDYFGSVEISLEDSCIYGEILFVEDTVVYEADEVSEIQSSFEVAVDSYISTCAEIGREPQKPCKGSFNVRIPKELHRQASIKAKILSVSLNEFVKRAIEGCVGDSHIHHHHHDYHHEEKTFNHIYEIDSSKDELQGGAELWQSQVQELQKHH